MVDSLPDPSIPLSDRDRARLRPDINQTVLQGLLAFWAPAYRAAFYELACVDPDLDAIQRTLTQAFAKSKNAGSHYLADPAVAFTPEVEAIFGDPVWQTMLENTAASAPGVIHVVWKEHRAEGFPPGAHGVVVDGVDLDRLDADIAGCIDAFVESDALDSMQREILQAAITDANRILPRLKADVQTYFQGLAWIATLVARHGSDAPAA